MSHYGFKLALLHVFILAAIRCTLQHATNPAYEFNDAGEYSGDNWSPITLDKIKQRLKESGVFDCHDRSLTPAEKKQLGKLFEAVEVMTSSRSRQPSNVQNMFSSLRVVERAMKKLLKEGQISESLASKFKWERISRRHKRSIPALQNTDIRVFNL